MTFCLVKKSCRSFVFRYNNDVMSKKYYEIYFATNYASPENWQDFFRNLRRILGVFERWQILVRLENSKWRYFLVTTCELSASIGVAEFFLKPVLDKVLEECWSFSQSAVPQLSCSVDTKVRCRKNLKISFNVMSFAQLVQKMRAHQCEFYGASLRFALGRGHRTGIAEIYFCKRKGGQAALKSTVMRLPVFAPQIFLSINFDEYKHYTYQKISKYCRLDKTLGILHRDSDGALLQVTTFPYVSCERFLHLDSYDFLKHTLVIGGSGVGKSKFLALLIKRLYEREEEDCRVIVVDPHDALKNDIDDGLGRVIDFRTLKRSVNLFECSALDYTSELELLLDLFRSLIAEAYNGRLERVLRFASCVLLSLGKFSFLNLKRILLDLEFRQQIFSNSSSEISPYLVKFFQTEFSELKNKYYNEAIAPIVALIDEMQMVPVFSQDALGLPRMAELIERNFLNIFSLNRSFLGERATKIIAGLVFGQLFAYAEMRTHSVRDVPPLVIIIDEVAVVEAPILQRFLSELRKYQVTVILVGQFFGQISAQLRAAIFANTVNYFLFRTSYGDAELLAKNLDCKVVGERKVEDRITFLAGLKNRECIARIQASGRFYPIFQAKTIDLASFSSNQKRAVAEFDAIRSRTAIDSKVKLSKKTDNYIDMDKLGDGCNKESVFSLTSMERKDNIQLRKANEDSCVQNPVSSSLKLQHSDKVIEDILDQPLNFDNLNASAVEDDILERKLEFPDQENVKMTKGKDVND